jgi:Tfp pilus assembly protein PilF
MLLAARQDYTSAFKPLQFAIEHGISEPEVFNEAGIAASLVGNLRLARQYHERALTLAPNFAEAHLNLGFVFQKSGRADLAKKEYATACQLKTDLCRYVPR